MRMKRICLNLLGAAVLASAVLAPVASAAQSRRSDYDHRQQTKNQWRNLAIGGGALGLLGLLKHDDTLTFAGTAGGLYSYYRYDQDRKSQGRMSRARAEMFRRGEFDRNGHHYVRRTVHRNGKSYYQFVRRD